MEGENRDASSPIGSQISAMARRARLAARAIAPLDRSHKDRALAAVARAIRDETSVILEANRADVGEAKERGGLAGSPAMIDRLMLDASRVESMARAVEHVVTLADPVGRTIPESETVRPNGVSVKRVRVPIGVIAMI